jgi:hypothetical protein
VVTDKIKVHICAEKKRLAMSQNTALRATPNHFKAKYAIKTLEIRIMSQASRVPLR